MEERGKIPKAGRGLLLGLALAAVAVAVQADVDFVFRSDDLTLIVQGAETSALGCLLRSFMRPFADIGTVAFYRPLFSFDFGALGRLFGDDPRPHGLINLALQGLSVLLGHATLRRLGAGGFAALAGSLLFALQPWAVNNVAWLVGRSTTVATVTVLGVYLLDRRALDRDGRPSLAAAILLLGGMLYRETSAYALVLIPLSDLIEGRPSWRRTFRLWPLLLAVLLPLGLRLLVIGDLVGGYGALDRLRGVAERPEPFAALGPALVRLLGAAPGTAALPLDWRALLGASLAGLLALLALSRSGRRGWLARAILLFALLHALPLLAVDPEVQAGSSQRWHSVLWALCALVGLGVDRVDRRVGLALLLVLAALFGWRLRDDLADYDDGARAMRSLRQAIERSAEPVILAHGLVPYVGCSPFLELGAGQLVQPPFGDGRQVLYPLMAVTAHGPDSRLMQTPLAARFLARGEAMSPIHLDLDALTVVDMPPAEIVAARRRFEERSRLVVNSPVEGDRHCLLDLDPGDAGRIEIHFMTPLAELWLIRRRGDPGFPQDAGHYREDLAALEEIGRHLDGAAHGRCYLWVTAHADRERLEEPIAVSEIIAIDLEDRRR
ncbi:MAG: hypothetical protein H6807_00570 [Planctomycetes bacterium]|nr:hypothetical protein [Planctomycetota bacterium]